MSEKEMEKRSGCSKPVVTFMIVAIACVVAFLIVALVKTCSSDEEAKKEEKTEQKQTQDNNAVSLSEIVSGSYFTIG